MSSGHSGTRMIFLTGGILLIAAGAVAYLNQVFYRQYENRKLKPFTVVSSQQVPPAAAIGHSANPNIEKQA